MQAFGSVMSKLIMASSYLHNFCVDASYAWAGHTDIFSTAALTSLRGEFVEALQHASGASGNDDNAAQLPDMPALDDEQPDGIADSNSERIRDDIAHYGWREYQTALHDDASFANLHEADRTALYQPVHQAAHALATGFAPQLIEPLTTLCQHGAYSGLPLRVCVCICHGWPLLEHRPFAVSRSASPLIS